MRLFFIVIVVLISSCGLSAQKVSNEILTYDYLKHNYEFLDEDYSINIASDKFKSLMKKYKFHEERINCWKDSIAVITIGEFGDWQKSRIAHSQITLSFLRVSYYLWISETETFDLAKKYHKTMPYRFYEYFRFNEKDWDSDMRTFMNKLRVKVSEVAKNPAIMTMSNRKFLKQALIHNPERQKAAKEYEKNRAEGEGCGRTNCCQQKDKKK
ncbi:MAG: hypothetical protein JXR82_11710 [Marinifilaceae bacterium]|nr:hypothetical protein [Marinifilaceae bacterium]